MREGELNWEAERGLQRKQDQTHLATDEMLMKHGWERDELNCYEQEVAKVTKSRREPKTDVERTGPTVSDKLGAV